MNSVENGKIKPQDLVNGVYARVAGVLPEWYYKPHWWEKVGNGILYRALGVELFKKIVPAGGDRVVKKARKIDPNFHIQGFTLRRPSKEEVKLYEIYTRIHEVTHMLSSITGLGLATTSVLLNNQPFLLASGIMTIANIYPVMLQRYNRERMYRVLDKVNRRNQQIS